MNPNKTRYRTTNWPEYNRSLQSRGSLTVWMSPDILWLDGVRSGAQGRPKVYTDAAIQAILTLKVLFKLALRQARGLVSSLLKLLELDWPVPCFSTVSRRQATLTVKIPVRRQTGPLHLLVDSTGIKICGEGEWKVKKHGAEYRRSWRKVHLAIDAETLDVRAVEMTDHRQGDAAPHPAAAHPPDAAAHPRRRRRSRRVQVRPPLPTLPKPAKADGKRRGGLARPGAPDALQRQIGRAHV